MSTLAQLYQAHQGKVSDKWTLYLHAYERLFGPVRSQPVRMLEIGVQNGGSLDIWAKYFADAACLIGCDINQDCHKLTFAGANQHLVVGDANTDAIQRQIEALSPAFDIVLDDGSHWSSDIVKSFVRYFPLVVPGGMFVAEDLHCSYWQEFEGGLYDPNSSIAFFKKLADVVNHEHWGNGQHKQAVLQNFADAYGVKFDAAVLSQIHSIEFINSMCVVRKLPAEQNSLGTRHVAGQRALVMPVIAGLHGTGPEAMGQQYNRWATLPADPAVGFFARLDELAELKNQYQDMAEKAAHLSEISAEQDEIIQHLRSVHEATVNSWSWRITRPLRVVRRLAHLVKRYGVVGLLTISAKVLHQEGAAGLLARLRPAPPVPAENFDAGYAKWLVHHGAPSAEAMQSMADWLQGCANPPLISVVVPVYNPEPANLLAMIDSVRQQNYPHWQLCLADDASPNPEVRKVLLAAQQADERIKVVCRDQNGHISAASNSALALATGQWVALLDHDDLLAPHALCAMAQAIEQFPQGRVFYSDEDKIDDTGRRYSPHFKPAFNYDLLLSHNYISHLGVYNMELVKQVGGFRLGYEGAQDYDLLLRCLLHIEPKQVVHLPQVLYHWRSGHGSTAMDATQKNYTGTAGLKALNDYLAAAALPARAEAGPLPNAYRVRWAMPNPAPLVSLVIPTRNGKAITENCINSILAQTDYPNYEILLVDNQSDDVEALAYFAELEKTQPRVRVLKFDKPFNYSAINNFAVHHAKGTVIGLVNNDVEVINVGWLTEMVSQALRPNVGCVGAKLYYSNTKVQHAGVVLGIGGVAGHSHKYFSRRADGYFGRLKLVQNFSAVTAACLLLKKTIYDEVGGLDEAALAVAFNDVDFCLKVARAGYRNLFTPYAELYHHESITRGAEDSPEKVQRFNKEVDYMLATWGGCLAADPCYNPNLTLSHETFAIHTSTQSHEKAEECIFYPRIGVLKC